ncbi:Leucine-rich repeat protein kinase family protein [Abeliophyllum distichum]|uniref:Leucine-rich repeat protein kinase family protein n=1 Tax=Abeliophyllum distichum TaxID=126358 RepID=A0ABD1THS5_9LAMI
MEIGNLSKLQMLYIGTNDLIGSIPNEIGLLPTLQQLDLSRNDFTDILKFICLNGLTWRIPNGIGNISALTYLDLSTNGFSGNIPQELGQITSLEVLNLSINMLEGEITESIFNLSMLQRLSFVSNSISGNLPPSMANGLPYLRRLFLYSNRLSGEIPGSISNFSKLTLLDLGNNSFSGRVPMNLGNLKNLQVLALGRKQLTNDPSMLELDFLISLTNCRQLKEIQIGYNNFDRMLPKALGNLSASLEIFLANSCGIREYGSIGLISTTADVYSDGIMLMETFTKRKPTDDIFVGEFTMRRCVFESFPDAIMQIMDGDAVNGFEKNIRTKESCLRSIMGLALECTAVLPEERLNLKDVLTRLKKIKTEFSKNN